ncbi:MAG: alpha-N-acetylglucosaminidase [Bacteroidales bacterium]|nr:alpha-N-acetylglucosaminidase [Bacteroidales bacterium]
MKRFFLYACAVLALAMAACSTQKDDGTPDAKAAAALTARVIPDAARHFVFETLPADTCDFFTLRSEGRRIVVGGNNANSMAVGLNYYLKYYCHTNIGWFAWDKGPMPKTLPRLEAPVRMDARVPQRFFLNYCTYGYTMPWWNWEEWEHFIDWMALNGINLPLAITGQESVWYQVWTELGLTDEEVRSYFTGPAHLPWHRMLNIDRWGGPLPKSWLEGQEALQKKIVARERELNMKPVLPAFAGHVPPELARIYPDAKIERMSDWAGFALEDYPWFLDPEDKLFPEIQKRFLEKEVEIYGTDHIYGIDVFNEMIPRSWETDYLAGVSKGVYESLAAADPEATWLQMTWLFYNERKYWFEGDSDERVKAYLTSYPAEKSILLDYYCERMEVWRKTQSYYGIPFIWCYLGNFGGNTYLAGNIQEISKLIEGTFAEAGRNFKGIGSTLEGFDCNPFMYQFIFEKAWNFPQHRNLDEYADCLAWSRTGVDSEEARDAWKELFEEIYIHRSVPGHSPLMNLRPSFGRSSSYHSSSSTRFTYENEKLREVIRHLLAAGGHGPSYEFDLVNLTRQYLSNDFEIKFAAYKEAYEAGDRAAMAERQAEMMAVFDTMETLLSSQDYFLVGKWIADARAWGATPEEADYFETNARNLITSWGDRGNLLTDYADRSWAGLTGTYYKGRWEMFFRAVEEALAAGEKFEGARADALLEQLKDFEYRWWAERPGQFAATPTGDPVALVQQIME